MKKQTTKSNEKPKEQKGFAVMDKNLVRKIATMGGVAVSKDRQYMREIGRIGGNAPRKSKASE